MQIRLRAILSYNDPLDFAKSVYGFARLCARNARGITWPLKRWSTQALRCIRAAGVCRQSVVSMGDRTPAIDPWIGVLDRGIKQQSGR